MAIPLALAHPTISRSAHPSALFILLAVCVTLLSPGWRPALTSPPVHVVPVDTKPGAPLSPRLSALLTGHALSLPTSGPGSLLRAETGDPLVYIHVQATDAATLAALEQAGALIIHRSERYHVLTAAIAAQDLLAVAAVPGVITIQEALAPGMRGQQQPEASSMALTPVTQASNCPAGTIVSDGDTQLRAAEARATYGIDGSGVVVGVLSGSYNVSRSSSIRAAQDIASGDLPGAGNPCGYSAPVQVIAESRINAGRDEGRAMLQIIHDLAPGASLAFANASDGLYAYADHIRRLRAEARADIIVDDYYYPEEPFFQDGPITTAIREVTQDGAIYVTSGGNIHIEDTKGRPIGSYETPAYRPTPCPTLTDPSGVPIVPGDDCHDFDPRAGTDARLTMLLPAAGVLALNTQWSEPWYGVATDLDIYLVDQNNLILGQSINGLGPAPFEFIGYRNTGAGAQQLALIVARVSGGAPRFKATFGSAAINAPTITELAYVDVTSDDLFGPTVTDHALSADAITVGAVLYNDSRHPAPFSSYGPGHVYWAPVDVTRAAPPLPEPQIRLKPDILATSGAQTTFFGRGALDQPPCVPSDPANTVCRFYGTSASAPHVAGVLALIKQYANQRDRALDQGQAKQVLERTAATVRAVPEARGAGLVDAFAAVAAVDQLPAHSPSAAAPQLMPNLVGLTEQQAREQLLRLGVAAARIVPNYQDRAKLGDQFDRTPAFRVVSTLPAPGVALNADQLIILGVRGPESPLPLPQP